MSLGIRIRGDGVAARCCAHLLTRAGLPVVVEPSSGPRVPVVVLGDQALSLIRDIFDTPTLLAGHLHVDRRLVAWGPGGEPVSIPHSGVAVSEAALLAALPPLPAQTGTEAPGDFVIHAASPLGAPHTQMRFGARRASALPVRIRDAADHSACLVESLDGGWLFVAPIGAGEGWLLAVGAPADDLLAQSRVVARRIEPAGSAAGAFDSSPRLSDPTCGDGWLACGTAAVGFDPICGDGVANAVREAILAAAVIVAIDKCGPAGALLSHYQAMLTAAMRRHLGLCASFYRSGHATAWWDGELQALAEGYDWCTARLAEAGDPKYQLRGFDLVAREFSS
ncbi:hypothetical protein [Phenylobacterium sp.]|jgi:hypothetical protein|uniref:hypothetical protein n=1 Tax=Phenylobacterium sp. TaxID=1871053 RepID=UPI003784CAEF